MLYLKTSEHVLGIKDHLSGGVFPSILGYSHLWVFTHWWSDKSSNKAQPYRAFMVFIQQPRQRWLNWTVILDGHSWLVCNGFTGSGLHEVYSSLSGAVLGDWQDCDWFITWGASASDWRQNTCLGQGRLLANLLWDIAEAHAGWGLIYLFIRCFHRTLVNRKILKNVCWECRKKYFVDTSDCIFF